jgi:hypothetical protein
MKPYQSSSDKENCSPISSNCVIWQGPNISCINLCKGDSVSDIVYKLASNLCDIQASTAITEPNGVSLLQLDCLLQLCAATATPQLTTAAVLQLIIDKICCTYSELSSAINELEIYTNYNVNGNSGNSARSSGSYSEPILDLPSCLYYADPYTEEIIRSLALTPYVIQLATAFCSLQGVVKEHTTQIGDLAGRVTTLENAPCCYNPPSVIPFCSYGDVTANVVTPMEVVVRGLDFEYCSLRNTLGTNAELTSAASSQCLNLNSLNALSQEGTMAGLPGWNNTINSFAQSMQNLWLTVCDMRGVINDLKNCCGASKCSSFLLGFTVGSPINTDELTLVFNALTTIPGVDYIDCLAGSTVTVTDGNNTFTTSFLLINDAIDNGYKTFNITSADLNPDRPWTITVTGCISNAAGVCSKTVTVVYTVTTTTTTTTTTAAPCTTYLINANGTEISAATGNTNPLNNAVIYASYYFCGATNLTALSVNDTAPVSICVKPGTTPILFYFASNVLTSCILSTFSNTTITCP